MRTNLKVFGISPQAIVQMPLLIVCHGSYEEEH